MNWLKMKWWVIKNYILKILGAQESFYRLNVRVTKLEEDNTEFYRLNVRVTKLEEDNTETDKYCRHLASVMREIRKDAKETIRVVNCNADRTYKYFDHLADVMRGGSGAREFQSRTLTTCRKPH